MVWRFRRRDVGGEEVDVVAVEVALGAVVVLVVPGGGGVGQGLGVEEGRAGGGGDDDGGVPQGVRSDVSGDLRGVGDALDHPEDVASVDRLREIGRSTSGPVVRCPRQASSTHTTTDGHGRGGRLVALPTRCSTQCPRRGAGVALDADAGSCGF